MTIHLDKLDTLASQVLQSTFPEYHGHTFKLEIRSHIRLTGAYWSGGSKSDYALYNTDINKAVSLPDAPFLQHSQLHETDIEIPQNFIIVEHSIFCGKDSGITFYVSPKANTHLLPGKSPELSRNERIVLYATRLLKSSYAGISNYRYHEANRETGISLADWNSTKQTLINKGMLNTAGAITNSGKNAIDGLWSLRDC